jgi:hypothetical protein
MAEPINLLPQAFETTFGTAKSTTYCELASRAYITGFIENVESLKTR